MSIEDAVIIWSKYILAKGKFDSLKDRIDKINNCLTTYFSETSDKFISNNSKDFQRWLEEHLGPVEFTTNIAMKLQPEIQIFIKGSEVVK